MKSLDYLQALVGQSLSYAIKSFDTELYDFGFYNAEQPSQSPIDVSQVEYVLHVICRVKVIWNKDEHRVQEYYEDTPYAKFHSEINQLIGLEVKRVALSDKNDLWLDFGDCWVAFATHENSEESWRFFKTNAEYPHLVASDSWLRFDY